MPTAAFLALLVCPRLDPGTADPSANPKSAPLKSPADFQGDPSTDSVMAGLRSLHQQRRWQELTTQFESQDFAAWPVQAAPQAAEALHLRGQAYAALKNGKRAERDLKASLRLAPNNELAWYALAENYARNLADDQAALAAYRQVVALTGRSKNGWLPISSTLEIAGILKDRVDTDEALRTLDGYGDVREMAPIWRIRWLRAYGHIYAARGDEQASLAKFREALDLEAAPEAPRKSP